MGRGDALGGGVPGQQLEDPAGGEVLGEGGQLGEGAGHEVVQLVDRPGGLLDLGLEPPGDLAERGHGREVAGVASGCSTTAKRAMAWLSVSSVVRLGKWAFW